MSERDHLDEVGVVVAALTAFGAEPTLVGGMALVILGSQRVTRDFDFVIAHPKERVGELVDLLYGLGFELVSRFDANGEVRATIDNRRVAAVRLRMDAPASVSFFSPASRLRFDLLFDFPIAASELAGRAARRKIRSLVIHIASDEDLLQLKRIAHADRALASDAQDIAFLEARRSRSRAEASFRTRTCKRAERLFAPPSEVLPEPRDPSPESRAPNPVQLRRVTRRA